MDLSLIMPAKNVDKYLIFAVKEYINNSLDLAELIIVLDSFKPQYLYSKLIHLQKKTNKLHIYINKKKGRVEALNYGFKLSKGSIIKCIDSDDILLPDFYKNLNKMTNYDAHCHNAIIANNDLKRIISYTFNPSILNRDYLYLVNNMISSPRWSWSFSRKIGKVIFPIPNNLFAEDFWFTFIIKKKSKKILYLDKELYIYRQHKNNEWGGVINFSQKVVHQRSKWLLNEISQLQTHRKKLNVKISDFNNAVCYHSSILKRENIFKIIILPINIIFKLKMIIILYIPKAASLIIKIKWILDKYRFLK